MKKYSLQILMGIVILFGFISAISPHIINYLPKSDEEIRTAKSEEVAQALAGIFQSPDANISDAHAIHKQTAQAKTVWFSFRTTRKPMQRFIHIHKLKQKDLSEEVLNTVFHQNTPPASWWHADLGTKTYFTGQDGKSILNLIYNSRTKRGVLVVSTPI